MLVGAGLVARNGRVGTVERWAFHAVNGLPDWLYRPLWIFQQCGNLVVALRPGPAGGRRAAPAEAGGAAAVVAVAAKLWLEQVVKSSSTRRRRGRPSATPSSGARCRPTG